MAKAYWVVCYHSITDENALKEYAKLAGPASEAMGARYLARGMPTKTYEAGINQRTVVVEFPSLEKALAAHDSPEYQKALKALGNAAKRDIRIIEGLS